MMSLVAYGSSGESDSDSEEARESTSPVKRTEITVVSSQIPSTKNSPNLACQESNSSLHSKLPPPKTSGVEEEVDEVAGPSSVLGLSSKLPTPKQFSSTSLNISVQNSKPGIRKGPVKILIPSLSDFPDDDDEPRPKKKIQPSAKGSGLFALLPPPQQKSVKEANRSLVPNSVVRKPQPSPPVKKPPHKLPQKVQTKKKKDSDSESDGENNDADFFSLNKEDELPFVPAFETAVLDSSNVYDSSAHSQYEQQGQLEAQDSQQFENTNFVYGAGGVTASQVTSNEDYIPVTTNNLELDDEAIRQLCGRQGKRRREEVQIVDVSGDAIMPDQREWLTKQLTEEQPRSSSSKSKLFGPSSQQRRKHQITYLAHVAKENEIELKNQWANNRQTRKQTQSKYGF